MLIGLSYVDDRVDPNAVQSGGVGWIAESTQFFAGYVAGDIRYHYTYEVYGGQQSWGNGSNPMAREARAMEPWRLRNALRSVKAEFLAVSAALQAAVAQEIGGQFAPDPDAPWLDQPMESAPEPEPEG